LETLLFQRGVRQQDFLQWDCHQQDFLQPVYLLCKGNQHLLRLLHNCQYQFLYRQDLHYHLVVCQMDGLWNNGTIMENNIYSAWV
jgi:hypothetical protein